VCNFCDDRLRGFGVAGVGFPVFPLTCVIAFTTLSHYRARLRVCDYPGLLLFYLLIYSVRY